jgi:hypothetical protein
MHYPAGSATSTRHPLNAILRAHSLSARSPQLRFVVRGTKGAFTKYGLDVQENTLKAMDSPNEIFNEGYGTEPEALWGTVETIESDEVTVKSEMYVLLV